MTNEKQSITVLALDCADYQLLRDWNCSNLLLDDSAPLETFTWSQETPHTLEIWPTVATGVYPDEHGIIVEDIDIEWDRSVMQLAQSVSRKLIPQRILTPIGRLLIKRGVEHGTTAENTMCWHPFDQVYQWPGIGDSHNFKEAKQTHIDIRDHDLTETQLKQRLFANTRDELAWLAETNRRQGGLTGTHSHVLDVAGHVFADRRLKLKAYYERVDNLVGQLLSEVENLVIPSDHGIQVSWLDSKEVGEHSLRSYIATRGPLFEEEDVSLPKSMIDVSTWLADLTGVDHHEKTKSVGEEEVPVGSDTTEETLRSLGYILVI